MEVRYLAIFLCMDWSIRENTYVIMFVLSVFIQKKHYVTFENDVFFHIKKTYMNYSMNISKYIIFQLEYKH